jgi:TP901 family phage tail tape measure protein
MAIKKEKAQIDLIINGATANTSIRDLEAAARKAKSELRGMAPDSAKFKEMSANLANINKELEKTKVQAGLAKSSWEKMKDTITATLIGNLGANLVAMGFEKIAGYVTGAFDAAVKLSDQMANVRKTTSMTEAEVKGLRTELSKIDTRTSMSDLMEIAKVGGQFGIAKEQIAGFVKAVDMTTVALGDEFTGGAEQVATEMSKLRNIFKDIQTDDVGTDVNFISNAINELAAAGVATGPVVADLANRIGGVGIQLGLSSGQVLGLSATLQELGVSSERGGTAVTKILQKMLTNTDDFAKIAGINVSSFKDLLNKDLYGAFIKVMEGSKQLGPNAGLLAGIIKDLEVQGASASEVFAKLGSNTDMLNEKTTLASKALTNTSSITEEFRLKNDNLAGSVAQLNKEWNKLTSNPAMVSFFTLGVDLTRQLVGGVKELADWTARLWGGKAEAAAQSAMRAFEEDRKNQEREKQIYAEQLASYKLHLKKLTDEDLAREAVKLQIQQQSQITYMRDLMAEGDKEQFYIELKYAKQLQAEANAIAKVQKARLNATQKGNEEMSAEEKKAAAKKAKEAQQELDRVYKLQMKHYDELIAAAEKASNEELKILLDKYKKQGNAANDFYQKEVDAALQLMTITAKTQQDEKAAVEQTFLQKMGSLQEGSFQYKLLYEQMQQELAAIDEKYAAKSGDDEKKKNNDKLKSIQSAADALISVTNTLGNWQNQQMNIEMSLTRKFYNNKKIALKDQLDNGVISQERYNTEIIRLNEESEQKERAMQKRQAESQRNFAMFESAIKAALAWVEAYIFPWKIPQAIAATAQAALIAAMPLPEFYSGGWMPSSTNDKQAFPIIAHANEYMVDAKSARDPYVMDTIGIIERAKQNGVAPSQLAANSNTESSSNYITNNYGNQSSTEKLDKLIELLENGLVHKFEIDDEAGFKLNKILDKQKVGDNTDLL